MMSYVQIIDDLAADKKKSIAGQISLFDISGEDKGAKFEAELPKVEEYPKEQLLAFEKEVLGIYISGHPLEAYEGLMKKNVTADSRAFVIDEETGSPRVEDGDMLVIGGMITGKTIKVTRNNASMAFVLIEDMFGTVEVILFPRDFEKFRHLLETDRKVFVRGKVTVEEDKDAKLICQDIILFDSIPREIWIKFPSISDYLKNEPELMGIISAYDGIDTITIYCEKERKIKRLPKSMSTSASRELIDMLKTRYSEKNVQITEKSIENIY